MSLSKVKLRYIIKKIGEDRYQVIDTKTNEVLWQSKQSNNEVIWFNTMDLNEADQLIKELI
jgi:hypothetical protein